ncbi:MAG: glycosyltransferase family 39 protein [Deltaproteobacteria bacterium]|nr:MAG: glycosyltransferase family 39 protein [Deltaproteobacteria bacterium]
MTARSPVPPLVGYAMGAVAAFGLALAFAFVCAPYPIEWAEGRVFDTARLILQGEPIYCDIQVLPCADLTYPPLYAALVAALARVFGLGFGIGRAVSFASLLWALVSLYRIARIRCDRWPALAAPAVFLCFVEACYFAGLLRPDFLSLALVLCGIEVLLRKTSVSGAVASALLTLLGLFVKPQAFAAVFAMTVHLAITDRKRLMAFAAVGAAGGAAIVVAGEILTGHRFLAHHLWYVVSPGHSWAQLGPVLFYGALPWTVFFAVALYQSLREGRSDFVSIYFFASLAWALVSSQHRHRPFPRDFARASSGRNPHCPPGLRLRVPESVDRPRAVFLAARTMVGAGHHGARPSRGLRADPRRRVGRRRLHRASPVRELVRGQPPFGHAPLGPDAVARVDPEGRLFAGGPPRRPSRSSDAAPARALHAGDARCDRGALPGRLVGRQLVRVRTAIAALRAFAPGLLALLGLVRNGRPLGTSGRSCVECDERRGCRSHRKDGENGQDHPDRLLAHVDPTRLAGARLSPFLGPYLGEAGEERQVVDGLEDASHDERPAE